MKPGGTRVLNTIYNFDRSNDLPSLQGVIGRYFDSRLNLPNGFATALILILGHTLGCMNGYSSPKIGIPVAILNIFPCIDNGPCPRLADGDCFHRSFLSLVRYHNMLFMECA